MAKCNYCSSDVLPGRGIIFVNTAGKILHFCSSKCRKNFKLNRKRKKWALKQKK